MFLLRETITEMEAQPAAHVSDKESLSHQIENLQKELNKYKYALDQSQNELQESENINKYLQHIYDEKIKHLEIHARQQSMNYELLVEHKLKSDTAFTTNISELENDIINYKDILETYTNNLNELLKENPALKKEIEEFSNDDTIIKQLEQEIENQRNKKTLLIQELILARELISHLEKLKDTSDLDVDLQVEINKLEDYILQLTKELNTKTNDNNIMMIKDLYI